MFKRPFSAISLITLAWALPVQAGSKLSQDTQGITMSTTTWTLIAVLTAIAIVGIVAWVVFQRLRTGRLRDQFGPEYFRELEAVGGRRRAEARLEGRKKRVEHFHIRPLTPMDRRRFAETWHIVQAMFVENPGAAVAEADYLCGDVMSTRGYPVANFEQRAADVSVDHPLVVQNYRAAHAIAVRHSFGRATTEDLRQAMIHYRALFEDLISAPETLARIAS